MRVLIASTYYWPETGGPGLHVTGPAEYLAARGHEVAVVTGFPHYPRWRPLVPRRPRATETHGGVTIRRRWLRGTLVYERRSAIMPDWSPLYLCSDGVVSSQWKGH